MDINDKTMKLCKGCKCYLPVNHFDAGPLKKGSLRTRKIYLTCGTCRIRGQLNRQQKSYDSQALYPK
jgi:hypothetical protein